MPLEPLRQHESGPYGELIRRPNPDHYIVRHVPSFERIIPLIEQRVGHPLTAEEIEHHRNAAPAIVVTAEQDARMREVEAQNPPK